MSIEIISATVLLAFFSSALLTVLVRKTALVKGFTSKPRADRYNSNTIALGGGVAIFIVVAIAAVLAVIFGNKLGISYQDRKEFAIITLLITALFALGLWDDVKGLSAVPKLIAQFAIAIIGALIADVRMDVFIENKLFTTFLSVIWVVLLINAFNFLDNMDGLCAGIAAISISVLCVAALVAEETSNAFFMLAVIGSLCGFLLFNFPPAKIFMGDAGSLVVGYCVAAMTMRTTYYQTDITDSRAAVFIPLIAMAVPLYDFASVVFLRLKQGKSPLIGDTQHFSHRLKKSGLSDLQVALTLYLATVCTGLGAVFLSRATLLQAAIIFLQTIMILSIIAILETTNKNAN